jgi:hypothetical protein
MRITPSDQPSNSDLSYRAGRWIAVAIVKLVGPSAKLAFGKANMRRYLLENRQQTGNQIEMAIPKATCETSAADLKSLRREPRARSSP